MEPVLTETFIVVASTRGATRYAHGRISATVFGMDAEQTSAADASSARLAGRPTIQFADGKLIPTSTGYIEKVWTSGLIRSRELTAGEWSEERTDCFCCTCGGSGDPCCRNHGWWGTRPCELHDMPGEVDEDGVMPASVQEYRRRTETRST